MVSEEARNAELHMFQTKRHAGLKQKAEAGGGVPADSIGIRYDIQRAALKAAISDRGVQILRGPVERAAKGGTLDARQDMANLIPAILQEELERLKRTCGGSVTTFADAVCLVMDTTTLAKEEKL